VSAECIQCKKGFGSTCYEDHEGFLDHQVELAAQLLRREHEFEMTLESDRHFTKPTNIDPDRYAFKLQEAFKAMRSPVSDMADAMSYAAKAMGSFRWSKQADRD